MIPNNQTYDTILALNTTIAQLKCEKKKLEEHIMFLQERNTRLLSKLQEYEVREIS